MNLHLLLARSDGLALGGILAVMFNDRSRLERAFTPFHRAHNAYLETLRAQHVREQIAANIALDILFVGLGGLVGGALGALLRAGLGAGGSTAVADIIKYTIRLAPQAILSPLRTAPIGASRSSPWHGSMVLALSRRRTSITIL